MSSRRPSTKRSQSASSKRSQSASKGIPPSVLRKLNCRAYFEEHKASGPDFDPIKYLRAQAMKNPNSTFKASDMRANIFRDLKILGEGHSHKSGANWCAKQYKTFKHGKVLEETMATHMATDGWQTFLQTARAAENQEAVSRMDVDGLTNAMVSQAAKRKRRDVESSSDESSDLSDHTDDTIADPLPQPKDFTSVWVADMQNAANAEQTHPETHREDPNKRMVRQCSASGYGR
ncbi:hypothetical protein BDZ88DRAFT_262905 [Geranomyces variabilis]|nr:hypothetical protein BDZ88DRAFT_262905 [Geranomyces variabilis]